MQWRHFVDAMMSWYECSDVVVSMQWQYSTTCYEDHMDKRTTWPIGPESFGMDCLSLFKSTFKIPCIRWLLVYYTTRYHDNLGLKPVLQLTWNACFRASCVLHQGNARQISADARIERVLILRHAPCVSRAFLWLPKIKNLSSFRPAMRTLTRVRCVLASVVKQA